MGINGEGFGFYKTLVFVPGALRGESSAKLQVSKILRKPSSPDLVNKASRSFVS